MKRMSPDAFRFIVGCLESCVKTTEWLGCLEQVCDEPGQTCPTASTPSRNLAHVLATIQGGLGLLRLSVALLSLGLSF